MTAVVGFSTGSTQHLYPPQIPQALRGLLGVWFKRGRALAPRPGLAVEHSLALGPVEGRRASEAPRRVLAARAGMIRGTSKLHRDL